jgi:hypothetical protein
MRRFIFYVPAVISLIFAAGCARTIYTPVDPNNDTGDGFRFYQSSPYLLVYTNGKGGITTQILYIADPAKLVSARPKNFLSKSDMTLEFENGVLTKSKTEVDATIVPSAIIKAAQSVATAFLAGGNDPQKGTAERLMPAPQLYKIVVNGSIVTFIGSENKTEIKVNLLKQEEETPKPKK